MLWGTPKETLDPVSYLKLPVAFCCFEKRVPSLAWVTMLKDPCLFVFLQLPLHTRDSSSHSFYLHMPALFLKMSFLSFDACRTFALQSQVKPPSLAHSPRPPQQGSFVHIVVIFWHPLVHLCHLSCTTTWHVAGRKGFSLFLLFVCTGRDNHGT